MPEMLDQDREAEAANPTPGDPDGDRGPVQSEEGPEDVLVPFVVPYDRVNDALTSAIDVWTMLNLEDRATMLATAELSDEHGVVARPITRKAQRVSEFIRAIAQSLHANIWNEQPLTVFDLVNDSHARAARKGFWEGHTERTDQDVANEKLLLIVSELTEAMEEIRSGHSVSEVWHQPVVNGGDGTVALKPEGFAIELADAMIRIADLAGWFDIDLSSAIRMKSDYNESRPHKHGKLF